MNRKQTQRAHGFFVPWVKKKHKYQSVFILCMFASLLFSKVHASSGHVLINEIMTADKNSTKNEFIELYNPTDSDIVLDKYKLTKKTASGNESNLVSSAKFVGTISAHGYFVIAYPDYAGSIGADLPYSGSSYSIADNNTVLLYDSSGIVIDKVGYGTASDCAGKAAENPALGESIGRLSGKDTGDNSQDFSVQDPTPGKENKKPQPPAPKVYSDKLVINELYPYPTSGEDEFIELYNPTGDDIDLENWVLHDASKTGKYVFPSGESIDKNSYLVVYKNEGGFTFALNNSGQESVTLVDPNGKDVSSVSYDGAKEGISYSFNGSDWHWTQFLTPGEENKFENVPSGTLEMDKDVFVNVWANFSIVGLSKSAKVTWDFGDNHKSYLQLARHKYAQLGTYAASVKFSQGSEDVTKNFSVKVEKIPHPNVDIVAMVANPKGSDATGETITLKNRTKKRVDLKGWSVATASKKKMINHPINLKFILKKKQTKTLTKQYSKFTLNNKKGKIELRYPDGKAAYDLKYNNGGQPIADDEVYQKVVGGWGWILSKETTTLPTGQAGKTQDTNNIQNPIKETPINTITEIPVETVITQHKIERTNTLDLKNDIVKIKLLNNLPHVLGAETLREENSQYYFTPQTRERKHYAIIFLENIFADMNEQISSLMNK